MLLGWYYNMKIYLGPLTYTDTEGKTTTFGIAAGPGNNLTGSYIFEAAIFTRLSNPEYLDWIKEGIKSNNNWYLIIFSYSDVNTKNELPHDLCTKLFCWVVLSLAKSCWNIFWYDKSDLFDKANYSKLNLDVSNFCSITSLNYES